MTKKGNQFEVELPAMRVVCPECDGCGTVLRDGMRGEAIDEESLSDPDFRESYFGGDYDVRCDVCNGANVILAVDESKLSTKMLERLRRQENEEWLAHAEMMAERRAGA